MTVTSIALSGPRRSEGRGTVPTTGPLVDRYGRAHDDLRLSVTDRCNLRCIYCMPDRGMRFLPPSAVLSFDEIVRLAAVARQLGVRALRLTGGEPLVRRGLVDLVGRLAGLGFDDLALTTNGMLLGPLAEPLAEAGLHRVNVSCDSLRPERFAGIRHRGDLPTVLRSMELAEAAGLRPLKVNVVLIRGRNDDEIGDFAAFARRTGRTVRFIEFMPLDAQGRWSRSALVPGQEVLDRIGAEWSLEPVPPAPGTGGADAGVGVDEGHAPAERFRFADGRGEIGIISTVSQPFCGSCNRLRVTAEGNLRNCLFSDAEVNVRDAMRQGCSDATLAALFRRAVWDKLPGHGINEPGFLRPRRSMSMIGG